MFMSRLFVDKCWILPSMSEVDLLFIYLLLLLLFKINERHRGATSTSILDAHYFTSSKLFIVLRLSEKVISTLCFPQE